MYAIYGSDEVRCQIENLWNKKKFDLHSRKLKNLEDWIKYKPLSYVVFSLSGEENNEELAELGVLVRRYFMIKFVWIYKGVFPLKGYSRTVFHYFIDETCSKQASLAAFLLNTWYQRELVSFQNTRMPKVRLGDKWEIKQVAEG